MSVSKLDRGFSTMSLSQDKNSPHDGPGYFSNLSTELKFMIFENLTEASGEYDWVFLPLTFPVLKVTNRAILHVNSELRQDFIKFLLRNGFYVEVCLFDDFLIPELRLDIKLEAGVKSHSNRHYCVFEFRRVYLQFVRHVLLDCCYKVPEKDEDRNLGANMEQIFGKIFKVLRHSAFDLVGSIILKLRFVGSWETNDKAVFDAALETVWAKSELRSMTKLKQMWIQRNLYSYMGEKPTDTPTLPENVPRRRAWRDVQFYNETRKLKPNYVDFPIRAP